MKRGFVKSLEDNGEGCIETLSGKQYKFHINTVVPEFRSKVFEGVVVEFEVFKVLGHPVPLNISLLGASNNNKGRIS